jgi:1-acyl-sn-glycerol-3-phosphate acyltransferase
MNYTVPAAEVRRLLLSHVTEFAGEYPEADRAELRQSVGPVLEAAQDAELSEVARRMSREDYGFGFHPRVPLVQKIHHAMADVLLGSDSRVEDAERLAAVANETLILLPNHLSFADANLIEVLLQRAGFAGLTSRLTVVAGPKVYTTTSHRFASLCFGTIKTAQSAQVASGEAVMRPRDVAKIARETIACAFERLSAGDALLLFAEGSRSRDATMQPLLPAVARYCERPGLWLVPCGLAGTEKFFGFDDVRPHETHAVLRIGTPVLASELFARCNGNRTEVVRAIGHMIAQTLPAQYRGAYAGTAPG